MTEDEKKKRSVIYFKKLCNTANKSDELTVEVDDKDAKTALDQFDKVMERLKKVEL